MKIFAQFRTVLQKCLNSNLEKTASWKFAYL